MDKTFDIAVIGGGIAGASVAAELSAAARVVLLEREAQPGFHATGRSAAMYAPGYGPAPVRALTRAGAGFFRAPPEGFADAPLLVPRDVMMIARDNQLGALEALIGDLAGEMAVTRLDGEELLARLPLLKAGYAAAGMLDQSGSEIDVHGLLQGYLRRLRARGGTVVTGAEVVALDRETGGWRIGSGAGTFAAGIVVNAAGAWADEIGEMAGAGRTGLQPKRRSAMIIDAPEGTEVDPWPLVIDVEEQFYLKPEAGRLLISPANEDPMVPCDVQPEELDIAYCVDRIERAFDLRVRRIVRSWAGLRSFVPDKCPVAGASGRVEGFHWLAGQGGYGIQTAPALSRLAAAQVLDREVPGGILAAGLAPDAVSPARLGM